MIVFAGRGHVFAKSAHEVGGFSTLDLGLDVALLSRGQVSTVSFSYASQNTHAIETPWSLFKLPHYAIKPYSVCLRGLLGSKHVEV